MVRVYSKLISPSTYNEINGLKSCRHMTKKYVLKFI